MVDKRRLIYEGDFKVGVENLDSYDVDCIFSEADEVAAAVSFPVKLALTLFKKIVGSKSHRVKTCAFAHFVKIQLAIALYTVELTLRQHKVCIGKTEHRIIGIAHLCRKGGVYEGAAIDSYRSVFAIPYQYVATVGQNPNY